MAVRNGLIIFPGALGDLICLVPAIHALGRRYAPLEFELMARAELARFAERRTPIVAGHSIDRREVASLFSEADADREPACKFFGRFARIDCFFSSDNERFRKSLQMAASYVEFYPFRANGVGHIAGCYLRAVGDCTSSPLRGSIQVLPEDLRCARQKLGQWGLEPRSFVLVLPGSGSAAKNWPAAKFGLLAERIRTNYPVLVVLGPAEAGLASTFHGRSLSVMRDPELGELAGIAHLARGFIGNDSGVSHLAAAAGARGVVIFGPTDPERWRPLGDVKIVQKQPLEDLTVEEVWPPVADLIAQASKPIRSSIAFEER
jgi:heptosyltransferase-3